MFNNKESIYNDYCNLDLDFFNEEQVENKTETYKKLIEKIRNKYRSLRSDELYYEKKLLKIKINKCIYKDSSNYTTLIISTSIALFAIFYTLITSVQMQFFYNDLADPKVSVSIFQNDLKNVLSYFKPINPISIVGAGVVTTLVILAVIDNRRYSKFVNKRTFLLLCLDILEEVEKETQSSSLQLDTESNQIPSIKEEIET